MDITFFRKDIAVKYGVNEAILFQNIQYWINKNRANDNNWYAERYWSYNSYRAFQELLPFLTNYQIRQAIKKLIDSKLIEIGNFNKMNYDRTTWYCIGKEGLKYVDYEPNVRFVENSKSIVRKQQMDDAKTANGCVVFEQPIPKLYTNNNTKKDDEEDKYNGGADFDFQEDKISKILQEYGFINISSYILKTINESGLTDDLKVEAVERWIGASDTTSQKLPSANYLKKILTNIKKSGVKTIEELETYENENKKSNSDRWYELQKEQVKLKQKELDLKEKNQPYYQKQIEMQSGKVEQTQQKKEDQDKSMALFTQYYDDYIKGNISKEKLQELGMDESLFFQLDSDKANYENDLEMKRLKAEYERKWGKKE